MSMNQKQTVVKIKNDGNPIYLRSAQGFDTRRTFRTLLENREEGAYKITDIHGQFIFIPAHAFETARRRVENLHKEEIKFREFPKIAPSEIYKLIRFTNDATKIRNDRFEERSGYAEYGLGAINLLLQCANRLSLNRNVLWKLRKNMAPDMVHDLKMKSYRIKRQHQSGLIRGLPFEEASKVLKIKFSSKTMSGYPFVFSFIQMDSAKLLLNTVYLNGDSMPENTIQA